MHAFEYAVLDLCQGEAINNSQCQFSKPQARLTLQKLGNPGSWTCAGGVATAADDIGAPGTAEKTIDIRDPAFGIETRL